MKCPNCQASLEPASELPVRVDRCPNCGGMWCDKEELRLLKDKEDDGDFRWIDVDLWKDAEKLRAGEQSGLACPADGSALTSVHYGDSGVSVDICAQCEGVWLGKGAYDAIIAYLEHIVDSSTTGDYVDDLKDEFVDVFKPGGEGPGSELRDLGKVLHLLELRFRVEHQNLGGILERISRGIPGGT
jgi:Zn-finger nucleic acid-binding protein